MPTYEYQCSKCGHKFEKFQSITSTPSKQCPACKKNTAQRLIGTGAGLIFKGSGFYITDYRSDGYKASAKADSAPSETKSTDSKSTETKSSDSKSADSKPATGDAKPAAKSESPAPKAESKPQPKPEAKSSSAKKRS
jgi:putative FmdB family regulatory protein